MRSSRNRLTWRTLRDCSERPFLWASSSSSTTIGRNTSCSSKRNIAVGSCMSTFVSSTKSRRCAWLFAGSRSPLAAPEGEGSERLRRFKNFLHVAGHSHAAPFALQYALSIDQKCAAIDTHVLAPVEGLFPDDVEQPAHFLVFVRQQVERQFFLLTKLVVRFKRIA